MANASDLIVYLTDHGGDGEFALNNFAPTDLVGVGSLDAWFDALRRVRRELPSFTMLQSGT